MATPPQVPQTYVDMAFRLVARHGIPTIVLAMLFLWLMGAFGAWWPSPMTEINRKLDYVIWLEQAICRRVFRGEVDRLRWLGCTEKKAPEAEP